MTTPWDAVAPIVASSAQKMIAHQFGAGADLPTSAGFLRRCDCGATAPTDEPCPRCGTTDADAADVVNMFDVYHCWPEAIHPIPTLRDGDPPMEIRIAAAGGGDVGAAYADNDWIYGVWLDGVLVCSGADLRSGGIAHTHRHMAAVLAECLAGDAVAPLRCQCERLGQWAGDEQNPGEGERDVR